MRMCEGLGKGQRAPRWLVHPREVDRAELEKSHKCLGQVLLSSQQAYRYGRRISENFDYFKIM